MQCSKVTNQQCNTNIEPLLETVDHLEDVGGSQHGDSLPGGRGIVTNFWEEQLDQAYSLIDLQETVKKHKKSKNWELKHSQVDSGVDMCMNEDYTFNLIQFG